MALKRRRVIGCWTCNTLYGRFQCEECRKNEIQTELRELSVFFVTFVQDARQIVREFGAGIKRPSSWLKFQGHVRNLISNHCCNCGLEPHPTRRPSPGRVCPIGNAYKCIQSALAETFCNWPFGRRWVVFCNDDERRFLRHLLMVFRNTIPSKDLVFRIFWFCICFKRPQDVFDWDTGANVILRASRYLHESYPKHTKVWGVKLLEQCSGSFC
jgi:hypothetical protein